MSLRTRPEGYGLVARALHWATVAALVAQLLVGYAMEYDDGSGRGRGRGRGGDSGHGRGRGGDDDPGALVGDDLLVTVHVGLGLTILALGVLRLLRRRFDGLPTWDERLSARDRRWVTRIERALLTLLFLVPLSGLLLVLSGEDDSVPLHVAAHVALYVVVAAHVGLVWRRGLLSRMVRGPTPS